MRFSETIFTAAASRRRAIARCFPVFAAVAAIGPWAILSQSHAATFNSNDFVGGYESLTGMHQTIVLNVDGSGVDIDMRCRGSLLNNCILHLACSFPVRWNHLCKSSASTAASVQGRAY